MTPLYYPVFLDLLGAPVLVVGGGPEAEARVESLLRVGARVTIVSPQATARIHEYSEENRLRWRPKTYEAPDLDDAILVFAEEADPALQHQVCQDARQVGVLVHRRDEPADSSFHLPHQFQRGPLQLAVHVGDVPDALVQQIDRVVADAVGHEFATLTEWLSEPRDASTLRIPADEFRHALTRTVLDSEVLELLRGGRHSEARARFESLRQICEASWSA